MLVTWTVVTIWVSGFTFSDTHGFHTCFIISLSLGAVLCLNVSLSPLLTRSVQRFYNHKMADNGDRAQMDLEMMDFVGKHPYVNFRHWYGMATRDMGFLDASFVCLATCNK